MRDLIRRALLRMLIITEKKADEKPRELRTKLAFFQRDIHIPPGLVAVLSALFLFGVLLFAGEDPDLRTAFSFAIFVGMILFLFGFYIQQDFPKLIEDDEAMMLLGFLLVFFTALIAALKRWPLCFYLTPLPAASLLCALLLHPRIAIMLTLVLSMIFGILHDFSFDGFFLALLGGLAATATAVRIRTHKDFTRAGMILACVHLFTLGFLFLLRPAHSFPGGVADAPLGFPSVTLSSFRIFFWEALWTALNGFLSAVLALGLLPFLEQFFWRLSPMKLLELADFNQPLLKRLMLEAPGTYHHSLMVATLAESAASAIGANALLARVGAYYHDIGKLVKPEYFIENQGNLPQNPHGNINPALSSLVVIAHIKEGVALAESAKLPPMIRNFIPMHHGTGRIEYFYQQAKDEAQDELSTDGKGESDAEVSEQNYRYPGPRPQTKETAIVMLADSVEAASRTVAEPSHTRFFDLVEEIVQWKVQDGQLANTPLTFSDLTRIKESFIHSLTTIHHARIEYPEEES